MREGPGLHAWAYRLDKTGALRPALPGKMGSGVVLLEQLAAAGAFVRRYGDQASLDMSAERELPLALIREFAERQAEYGELLIALGAPDMNAGLDPSAVV